MNSCFLKSILTGLTVTSIVSSCSPSSAKLTEVLEKHPEILTNAIDKNPEVFMASVQKAAQAAQAKAQQSAAKEEEEKFEAEFKTPLQPDMDPKRAWMGEATAPISIVEYTDFQCPYCGRGYSTLEEVRKMYGAKVRVLVKNLPLPMHPLAIPAAKRFEALRLQSADKASQFYHEVFANQNKLSSDGEKFLDAAVKKTGADVARLKKDMASDAVTAMISKDTAEAQKFGISGTPGFIINGVSVRGAYPVETFKKIIDRQLAARPSGT